MNKAFTICVNTNLTILWEAIITFQPGTIRVINKHDQTLCCPPEIILWYPILWWNKLFICFNILCIIPCTSLSSIMPGFPSIVLFLPAPFSDGNCFSFHNPKNSNYDYHTDIGSVQFSSAAQSCPTLCDPMNCSTPGLPVHHQFSEFSQTHIHQVSDVIQPSYPLSSPSPPALNPSQHQSLVQWVNSSHEVDHEGLLHMRIWYRIRPSLSSLHEGLI